MRQCLIVIAVLGAVLAIAPRAAAAREICFPNQPGVVACLDEPFAGYWDDNGGLPVFGFPLAPAQMRYLPDLNANLLTQWTERTRLEAHPENPAPYTILMGRLGAERLARMGRDPAKEGRESGPLDGCLWFEQTGHNVCDQSPGVGFKTYWQSHGLNLPGVSAYTRSLQLFGLPLTAAQPETNSSGATVLTQWFERARFEWHPDNPKIYRVLLGLVGREAASSAASGSLFGFESNPRTVAATAPQGAAAGAAWARYNDIRWSAVETSPGVRDWSGLAQAEAELRSLAEQGLATIVPVRSTPAWAQRLPGLACGPIKPEALDAFAAFMRDLVARYSQPPYNVHYWEVWNEPDADAGVGGGEPFGCWGDPKDEYYGGGAFAEMLKRVYPAIKQADPAAQVVLGGLLLDCDPDHPPPGKDCRSARFLEGVLRNGGGTAFDILAYHGYAYWRPVKHDWDMALGGWTARGGAVLGKLAFLRDVMTRYDAVKPVMLNEAGLLCVKDCPYQQYDVDQANYVIRLYARAYAQRLVNAIWFTLNGPGWRGDGLLDAVQAPRPGYRAFTFMARLLEGAAYDSAFSNGALEGYVFRRGSTVYSICWTNDGSTVKLPLPAGTTTLYDMLGQPRQPAGGSVSVGHEPVVIQSGG